MAESHVRVLKIISITEIVILILAFLAGLIATISLSMVEVNTNIYFLAIFPLIFIYIFISHRLFVVVVVVY